MHTAASLSFFLLFPDGVLCAKKDVFAPKHHDIEVPNLHVMNMMKSFVSKGLVTETFNWQWTYWVLTDKGIEYLRAYMSLPADVEPNSLKKPAKSLAPRRQFDGEEGGARGGFRGGRGGFVRIIADGLDFTWTCRLSRDAPHDFFFFFSHFYFNSLQRGGRGGRDEYRGPREGGAEGGFVRLY
jgi:small subunit ribosomal protein S10e